MTAPSSSAISSFAPAETTTDPAIRQAWAAIALALSLAVLIVVWNARYLTFYGDEWNFLLGRPGLFVPNNEHWSTLLYAAYYLILSTVGGQTYLWFLIAMLAAHAIAVGGIFVLLQERVGALLASVAAVWFALLGSASEDLYWGWQLGFVGSTAFGIWAIAALERKRLRLGALLILGALATSGIGLIFLAAAIVAYRSRWLVVAMAAYGAWYLYYGSSTVASIGHPFSLQTVVDVPAFAARGILNATSAAVGLQGFMAVGIPVLAWLVRAAPRTRLTIACTVGIGAEYVLIALARVGTFAGELWGLSRYVYPAGALLIVLLTLAASHSTARRLRVALGVAAAFAIVSNTLTLAQGARWHRYQLAEPFGCLPATIPAIDVGWSDQADVAVPIEARC